MPKHAGQGPVTMHNQLPYEVVAKRANRISPLNGCCRTPKSCRAFLRLHESQTLVHEITSTIQLTASFLDEISPCDQITMLRAVEMHNYFLDRGNSHGDFSTCHLSVDVTPIFKVLCSFIAD